MKAIQQALHRLAYFFVTVLMTILGVAAWALSALRDRKSTQSDRPAATPAPHARPSSARPEKSAK